MAFPCLENYPHRGQHKFLPRCTRYNYLKKKKCNKQLVTGIDEHLGDLEIFPFLQYGSFKLYLYNYRVKGHLMSEGLQSHAL